MPVDCRAEDEEPPHNPALNEALAGRRGHRLEFRCTPGLPQPAPAVGPGGQAPLWRSAEAQPVAVLLKPET